MTSYLLNGNQVQTKKHRKIQFRHALIPMPFLFFAGFFTGIAIMLATAH